MGDQTTISWTHHTFNAWIGCFKVSDGCKHCYAAVDTFARRSRANGLELWGKDAARHVTSEAYWKQPIKWDREAREDGVQRRVFCSSLSDIAEIHPSAEVNAKLNAARARLFALIAQCQNLTWQLLTKRPENLSTVLPEAWVRDGCPPNVMLGTTCENQEHAERRLPELLAIKAHNHFVSAEPLLGPLNLRPWMGLECTHEGASVEADTNAVVCRECDNAAHLTWVIVGGESGSGARPFDVAWARSIVKQCAYAGVACHVKQLGAHVLDRNDANFEGGAIENQADLAPWPEGVQTEDFWNDPMKRHQGALVRIRLDDRKGGDMESWPADLRVRQFPRSA